MKRIRNRNIFILLTIILSLGITLGAVYFMYQYKDSRENELKTSMISLNFTEKSEVINLSSNVPMIDDLGLKSRPYEFTITNTSTVPVKANITLDIDNDTTIKYGAVRYALFINDERVIKDYVHRDNLTLYEVSELKPNEVINCKLYFWIDYYYDYPGEIFKAKIKAVGESIDELQQEAITVTFDADGGTLNTTTKEVYYHGYYGELPTPTKEGYTFMGWNGKNMFSGLIKWKMVDFNNGNEIQDINSASSNYIKVNFDNSNQYFLSGLENNLYSNIAYYNENYEYLGREAGANRDHSLINNSIRVPSNISGQINYIKILQYKTSATNASIDLIDNANIQLEEGTVATEYEPYYIKSNTKVVQNGNHTLKAIWKENS